MSTSSMIPNSGTSLFLPFIWLAAGVSLFAGMHFSITGLLRRQERVFLAFGCLCLLVGVYMLFSAQWYRAESVAAVSPVVRWEMALACLMYPAFVWFFALYSGQRRGWPFWLMLALYGVLLLINLWSPYSFMYSHMTPAKQIVLPWGETVSNFDMTIAPPAFLYYALNYAIFFWAVWRCVAMWRAGLIARTVPVAVFLLLHVATMIHTEVIDNAGLDSVYLGEFPPLALVVLMSLWLGLELDRRSVALEASEMKLHYMAYHDYLTELPNRRQLPQELHKARQPAPDARAYGAMLFLDLDHFKTINDSLGHELGDTLLQRVARRLCDTLPADVTPIRLGGDEFAVVLPALAADSGVAREAALRTAREISAAITRPFAIEHHSLAVGVSIGIVVFSGNVLHASGNETGLMRQADMALNHAKHSGRNAIQVFTADMQQAADERLTLERGLRVALDHGELELHFQPQVRADGDVLGAEVLLRWQHPQLGFISPAKFIPIAEETGLIHPIGEFALREACARIREWETQGKPFHGRLSVNVSPWQLCGAGFVDHVKRIVAECGIDCSRLTLEITESSLLQDAADVAAKIRELSETGIRFAIDDFGTGYSALDWIKKIAFHELKIDRTFVHDMRPDRPDSFIETILSIAAHLNMQVVAEGIETETQKAALIEMGCNGLQGNLISPPLSEPRFLAWLAARMNAAG